MILTRLRRIDQISPAYPILRTSISIRQRLNCDLQDISYNFNYWGGTVIFSFTKSAPQKLSNKYFITLDSEYIRESISDFQNFKKILGRQLSFHNEIYYLGAAQMLPILHYHLKSEIKNLAGILDDNNQRIDKFLPSIEKKITSLSSLNKVAIASSGKVIGVDL